MKKAFAIVTAILAVCAILGVIGYYDHWFYPQPKALILYGNVDDRQVDLPFQISERIKAIHVEEGDVVKAGQLVGELETVRIENAVRSAEAKAKADKAAYEKQKNGPRLEDITTARAELAAVVPKLKAAKSEYERQKKLLASSSVSVHDYEAAEADYGLYTALLARQQSQLDELLAGNRQEDIDQAYAAWQQSESDLIIQRQNLIDAKLLSPCDGIVRNRILEPGEMASPQTPAMQIALTSPKWIRAYLSEPQLTLVKSGEKAVVRFDGAGKEFSGWVGFISPNSEFTPKNVESAELRTSLVYEVRIFVNDPDNLLKLGAPATVYFPGVMEQ